MNLFTSRQLQIGEGVVYNIMYETRLENPTDFVMNMPDWQQLELLSKIPKEQHISTMPATAVGQSLYLCCLQIPQCLSLILRG